MDDRTIDTSQAHLDGHAPHKDVWSLPVSCSLSEGLVFVAEVLGEELTDHVQLLNHRRVVIEAATVF